MVAISARLILVAGENGLSGESYYRPLTPDTSEKHHERCANKPLRELFSRCQVVLLRITLTYYVQNRCRLNCMAFARWARQAAQPKDKADRVLFAVLACVMKSITMHLNVLPP